MDENGHEKRIDLNDESGVTRREVLRRGAIVGGTLLWVAPAIQSISQKAFASEGSGGMCAACYCFNYKKIPGEHEIQVRFPDGGEVGVLPALTDDACKKVCKDGGFKEHAYCAGTHPSTCSVVDQGNNFFPFDPGLDQALQNVRDAAVACS